MPNTLIGRDEDRDRLRTALRTHRLVTLIGPPGVGKSALALAHAAPRTAIVVEAADVVTGAVLPALVADAAGLDPGDDEASWALPPTAADLVVLDHVDQVLEATRALVSRWLGASGTLRVLVTSRQRLGLPQERCVDVAPLGREAARQLFLVRARSVRADYATGEGDDGRVRDIVARLDHLPLAIELAAAKASLLGPADLLARLGAPLDLLGSPDASGRSLQGLLEESVAGLPEGGRAALAWLSSFGGGFDVAAAEAVVGAAPGLPAGSVLDQLQRLADRSLLAPLSADRSGRARFRLLHGVRSFGHRDLQARGQADGARLAHAGWLADRAWGHARGLGGPDGSACLGELLGLRTELARVLGSGPLPPAVATRLALSVDRLHRHRGSLLGHAPLLDAALEQSTDRRLAAARQRLRRLGGAPAEALAGLGGDEPGVLLERAEALADLGRIRDALAAARGAAASLGSAAAAEDEPALPLQIAGVLARLLALRGKADEAIAVLDDALAATGEQVGPLPQASCLVELARIELGRGRRQAAGNALEQAEELLRPLDEPRRRADVLLLRAEISGEAHLIEQAAAIFHTVGDRRGEARAREAEASQYLSDGRLPEALEVLEPVRRLARVLGDVPRMARLSELVALAEWHLHGPGAAAEILTEASRQAEATGDGATVALVTALVAAAAAASGDLAAAAAGFDAAEERLGATTHRAPPPDVFLHRAHLDLAEGRPVAAAQRLLDSWALARSLSRNRRTAATVLGRRAPYRLALRLVTRQLEPTLRRETWAEALDPRGRALLIDGDGAAFRPPAGAWVTRERFLSQRRLLVHLACEHRRGPVPPDAIQAVLWPGERIIPEAAQNRIHKAVSLLRKAGAGDLVQRVAKGYQFDPERDVVALPDLPLRAP